MKTVILLLALFALTLSLLLKFLPLWVYVCLFILLMLLSAVFLFSKNKNLIKWFFAALLLSLLCFRAVGCLSAIERAEKLNKRSVYFEAIVTESSAFYEFRETKLATLKIISSNSEIKKGEKVLYVYYLNTLLKVGQKVSGEFIITSFDDSEYINSYYADGIYCSAASEGDVFITNGNNIYHNTISKVQTFITKTLRANTKNSAVLISMIYGEKGYIGDSFYQAVKISGVSHVLVVSGLHFSLIFTLSSFLCSLLFLKGLKKDIAMLLIALFYMGVCGFSVSVIRVGIIFFLTFISRRLKRIHSSLDLLIAALVLVLLINPFSIFSISFQLSFEATFGLLVLYPEIKKHIDMRFKDNKTAKVLLNTAAVSLSAFIFTLPTVIYHFSYIAVYSVVVNVLIGFSIGFMLGGSVIGLLLTALGIKFLPRLAFLVSDFFAEYFRGVVLFFSKLPFSTLDIKYKDAFVVVLLVLYLVVYELYTCKIRNSLVKYFKKEERE